MSEEKSTNFNPVKYYLENGLEDKEVHLWDEEIEKIIFYALSMDAYEHNVGRNPERLKFNIREKAFHDHWLKENIPQPGINQGYGLLQNLFIESHDLTMFNKTMVERINNRDRMIVATVIQWLGSNCGMCFLEEVLAKFHGKIVIDWEKFNVAQNAKL